jgi:RNA polymerase sigma-70 factor (ECF subfamily)
VTDDYDAAAVRAAVQAVRRGDRDAFAQIVRAYQRRLFGLMLMMTRDPTAAEELAQDAFVRAFVHPAAYDDHRPFYPWLATIAVRLAQNWLVRRSRTGSSQALESCADPASPGIDPLTELITDEEDRALWRSVSVLPSGERTAVLLFYRQEMSVAEIAFALGVSTGTVKTQLSRARKRLRGVVESRSAAIRND